MSDAPIAAGIVVVRGDAMLVALVLRSHRIGADGRTVPIGAPDADAIEVAGWRPRDDLALLKPCTDVVVGALAYAPHGRPTARMDVGVGLPERGHEVVMRVVGQRRVTAGVRGLALEAPEPFEVMQIDWSRAYGGTDAESESESPVGIHPAFAAVQEALVRSGRGHRGAYPRNPVGRGWLLGDDLLRFDGALLPNVEDPRRALRSDTLPVACARMWPRQPISAGFGWVDPAWFPRCAHVGLVPEVDVALEIPDLPRPAVPDLFWSGAAPGLAVAPLLGGEVLRTHGLDPDGELNLRLPRPPGAAGEEAIAWSTPRRWTVHTTAIDLPHRLVHTLWRAESAAPSSWLRAGPLRRAEIVGEVLRDLPSGACAPRRR